jgi:hypothetical protein
MLELHEEPEESEVRQVLPPFDFTEALGLTVMQRLERAVQAVRSFHEKRGYESSGIPAISSAGATGVELNALGQQLGVELPGE